MNKYIKLLCLPVLTWLMPFGSFAQSLPSDNIPVVSPVVQPVTITYPDLSYIGSSLPVNYVRTQIPDMPLDDLSGTNITYVRQITSYIDGLGRPLQEVAKHAHAEGYDLVQPHVYDSAGREKYQFLSYVLPVELSTGKLSRSVNSRMHHFYDNLGPDEHPFGKTQMDNFLAGRITRQLAPGRSWVGSDRAVEYNYRSNQANEVRLWRIGADASALPMSTSNYPVGEIMVTKVTDEDNKVKLEYKDKSGTLIMTKVMANNNQPEYDHDGHSCTYYVYDELGRLRFVIPPEAVIQKTVSANTWSLAQAVADGLCYRYFYDKRGRTVEKKIPGRTVEYYAYDKRDRQVLYQDGNMRNNQDWAFTIYDVLDRPVCTGIYHEFELIGRSIMQTNMDNSYTFSDPHLFSYLKRYDLYHVYPSFLTECKILSYTYYDNYNELQAYNLGFDANQFDNSTLPTTVVPSELSNHTRGLVTGGKLLATDPDDPNTNHWFASVNYYDNEGRMIQTQSQNIRTGVDISSNIYYFQGMLWRNILHHQNPGAAMVPGVTDAVNTDIVVTKTFDRNLIPTGGNDQVLKVTQKIGNGIPYDLATYSYDHLGRATVKQYTAANVLNEFNIRGFLTHIDVENNNNVADSQHIFEEKLHYDKGMVSQQYNGNIAGIVWRKSGAQAPYESYGYTYDNLNRLNHAEYRRKDQTTGLWQNNEYDYTASNITYDMNGNIQTMFQEAPDMQPNGSPLHIDQLTYTYEAGSNKLLAVTDAGVNNNLLPDFKDGSGESEEYTYDSTGNMLSDKNKAISAITYNYFNKPEKITVTGQGTVSYMYDAAGNRLQKRIYDQSTSSTDTFDYIGNFVYKQNVLQYILNDEGRCRPIPVEIPNTNGTEFTMKFVYDYFVKDHLGNVRSTVTAKPMDGVYLAKHEIAASGIEQLVFDNIPNVRDNKPGSTVINDQMAARLNANDLNRRIGTAIMLQTMPGDRFNISADVFYEGEMQQQNASPTEDMIGGLLSALTHGVNYDGIPVSELPNNVRTVTTALNNPNLLGQLDNLFNNNHNPNAPKAHLSFLFFNDKLELIPGNSGVIQVPVNPMGWTTINPSMLIGSATTAIQNGQVWTNQPGYVIIFIDNQSVGKDVWFDNLMVGHYKGEVIEENHYYPFGLTLSTWQDPNVTKNPLKLTTKELESSFGINNYDFGARMQDMQLGRWWGIDPLSEDYISLSPYNYCANNPVLFKDLDGRKVTVGTSAADPDAVNILMAIDNVAGDKYRDRIGYSNSELSVNLDGLSAEDIAAEPGFQLLVNVINSSNEYLVEMNDVAEGVDRESGGSVKIAMYNPITNPKGPIDMNYSTTSRGQDDHDSYVSKGGSEDRWRKFDAKPRSGYDGQVTVPGRVAGLTDPESGQSKAGSVLIHGLAEVYNRTEHQMGIRSAHSAAKAVEESLGDKSGAKSAAPGQYHRNKNEIRELQKTD